MLLSGVMLMRSSLVKIFRFRMEAVSSQSQWLVGEISGFNSSSPTTDIRQI